MKMTKIEFWRKVKENGGGCYNILCNECPYSKKGDGCTRPNSTTKKDAESYIKRHERKSRKKPKPVKTVGIDNDDVTLAKPTVKENLSVPCEHLINGDSCGNPFDHCDKDCPANSEIPQPIKFDDPVPDKLYIAYSSFIRCYVVVGGFKKVIDKEMDGSIRETFSIYARPITDGTAEWLTGKECYRTLEEAVIVAKKLWQGEKK